ncbi:hypothetical protein ONA91_01235 [Micromonospora sp. DR5-3]|uniref:hypothetical protein n=1 Tax=unclassified Micromonospora TaxID=2617518 RepID=UPI0011DB8C09|nr:MULTISPECIES: hypothetical protein [unclassified Micromonospora]MCW3813082.1 hypothetical protein [Micromonospora sp. DR5-3]TYC25934.1 hypothetical protein FXF52_00730 [Micromonospora sp. MP36]
MGADDRVRGALLAGLTVAALAAGGWWWQRSAPALGETGASPSPSTGAFLEPGVRLADPDTRRVTVDPDARRVTVDPETGQVLPGPEADPDAGLVVHQEPGAAAEVLSSHAVWAERSQLAPGDGPLVRQANPSAGERHLLTVSCSGPGTLTVAYSGSDQDGTPLTTTCAETPLARRIDAAGGPLLVRFTVAGGAVDLDARLVALF